MLATVAAGDDALMSQAHGAANKLSKMLALAFHSVLGTYRK